MRLNEVVGFNHYPITDEIVVQPCYHCFDEVGVLVPNNFISPEALCHIVEAGESKKDQAYFVQDCHKVYQLPVDPEFPFHHTLYRQWLHLKV